MEMIDISPVVSPEIAVFPGDQPFQRKVALDFRKGDHLVLSAIESTVHVGAHTDAPNHYHSNGEGIDRRDLSYYFGPCQVVTVRKAPGERIRVADVPQRVFSTRVLFRTLSYNNPNRWTGDFVSLSGELVQHLARQGVRLVGIDTPSIDPEQDKVLEAHQAVFENNMAILEGIELGHVQDGSYTLIALPLKLKDADASPVRAVLVRGDLDLGGLK